MVQGRSPLLTDVTVDGVEGLKPCRVPCPNDKRTWRERPRESVTLVERFKSVRPAGSETRASPSGFVVTVVAVMPRLSRTAKSVAG
jgi:hypothetical protein